MACAARRFSSVCRSKTPGLVCSSHTSDGSVRLVDVGAARQQRARDDVEVAVAVEVRGLRALTPGSVGQRVLDEGERALVLEPLDAVVRLHDGVVERVAVRQQHVEVAVAVEIDQLDARRAPVRMRRRVDDLRREADARAAVVHERDHLLELLREHDDEVHLAVLVEVDRDGMDGAGPRIDQVRREGRVRVVGRAVLEHREVADLAPAEGRDREIELAVAVEVRGFDVGDARPAVAACAVRTCRPSCRAAA